MRRLDPDALYHPSFCDFDEEHIWDGGFPDGEFWDHYGRNFRFISEYGAIAPPVVETLEEILPPGAVWGQDAAARGPRRTADRRRGVLVPLVIRLRRPLQLGRPPLPLGRPRPSIARALRRRRSSGTRRSVFATAPRSIGASASTDIAGCRTWSYRENVPGIKFTVVDHQQRPKMGYFALQQAYAPISCSALDEQYPLATRGRRPTTSGPRVVNDGVTGAGFESTTSLHAIDGEMVARDDAGDVVGPGDAVATRRLAHLPASRGPLPAAIGRARRTGDEVARSEWWANVVEPVFSPAVRVLLLGQTRYTRRSSRRSRTSRASSSTSSTSEPAPAGLRPGARG